MSVKFEASRAEPADAASALCCAQSTRRKMKENGMSDNMSAQEQAREIVERISLALCIVDDGEKDFMYSAITFALSEKNAEIERLRARSLEHENIIDDWQARAESAEAKVEAALGYAKRFLVSYVEKYCDPIPAWRPLPELIGVLTQIDNASTVTGDWQVRALVAEAREAEARKVIQYARRWIEHAPGSDAENCLRMIDAFLSTPSPEPSKDGADARIAKIPNVIDADQWHLYLSENKDALPMVAVAICELFEKIARRTDEAAKDAFHRGYSGGLGFALGVCDEHKADLVHVRRRVKANLDAALSQFQRSEGK